MQINWFVVAVAVLQAAAGAKYMCTHQWWAAATWLLFSASTLTIMMGTK